MSPVYRRKVRHKCRHLIRNSPTRTRSNGGGGGGCREHGEWRRRCRGAISGLVNAVVIRDTRQNGVDDDDDDPSTPRARSLAR